MKAVRVHAFGGPANLSVEDLDCPKPVGGEVLVEVFAAGVGPWDAWIRSGRSVLPQPLPLTPGSDISGVVSAVGPDTPGFIEGQAVYGVTNSQFTGGYAQFARAHASMLALKPSRLSHVEAASVPVIAVTADQMLFKHAGLRSGQRVLIHGAAGNVGAYAVQLARIAHLQVFGSSRKVDFESVRRLGAQEVFEPGGAAPDNGLRGSMDAILDLVGGDSQSKLFDYIRPGGIIVSAVSEPDQTIAQAHASRAKFMLVDVKSQELTRIADLLQAGQLVTHIGEVLTLDQARLAHEMLDGSVSKRAGKIVLTVR
jgi:NADPH:quinone reductase-like Zn-dependent oxidoreductase